MRGSKFQFKIGISNNPKRRAKEVSHDPKVVMSKRFFFAETVESHLHALFKRHRVTRKGSGRTEWFKLSIPQLLRLRLTLFIYKILHDLLLIGIGVGIVVAVMWYVKNKLMV